MYVLVILKCYKLQSYKFLQHVKAGMIQPISCYNAYNILFEKIHYKSENITHFYKHLKWVVNYFFLKQPQYFTFPCIYVLCNLSFYKYSLQHDVIVLIIRVRVPVLMNLDNLCNLGDLIQPIECVKNRVMKNIGLDLRRTCSGKPCHHSVNKSRLLWQRMKDYINVPTAI